MVANYAITGGTEILQVAEAVAREKGIPKDSVVEALKSAIETIARKKYGHEQNIRAEVNQKSGEFSLFRDREITEEVEDYNLQISLADAKEKEPEAEMGGFISEPLPPIDFGRVASQTFKQVLMQKIREAEREKQYEDFKDRVGEIVNGIVKRVEYGNVIVDFGKTETILPRDQVIPREVYRTGERIRAYIVDVRRELKGPQIFLSRTHPNFLAELFSQEVPEIYDNIVEIKAVARDAGSRAKCAVYSEDHSIDPVGACIGPRGTRVTAVYNELQGEKIDIIQWSSDIATFAVNALASKTRDAVVEVAKIVIDEEKHQVTAVVPDDQLSLAIGRRGQNVRLASELIGWKIDVVSESDESTARVDDFNKFSSMFAEALDVEEVIGQLLASEGFQSVEEVAYVPVEDLLAIEGFEEELVEELRNRALEYLEANPPVVEEKIVDNIPALPNMNDEIVTTLFSKGVQSLDDFADLSRDEFIEIVPASGLSDDEIDATIMAAREHWFKDEDKEAANA